ncbi:MAG TPA: glycosyltransferase family 4 protein [Candidatus Acidoferrum sp.]|nr:glycosyltransferase family 4 protein [Candidatus Acidoferrum sp.]
MRVLYVDLEREWRGGQSQALLTLLGLRERELQVELVGAWDSPLAVRSREAGITVSEVARFGLRARAAAAIRRLLVQQNFDLAHLNEPHALTAAWLAGAHKRLPLLLSRRIGFPLRRGWATRARYAAVERFIANSKDVGQSLIACGIASERISIVHEGVGIPPPASAERKSSARGHWGVKEHEFLFGCVSVFVPEKGQRHLIEALATVRESHPEARLLLAGDGQCRGELESLAKRLGQSQAVLFPGFVNEVSKVYDALDAFAFPSEFEGLGTALQAAMAAGLPSISTSRGALAEVVDGERTTLVVEPNGKEFAAGMLRLITDANLRKKLGEAGRREVQERFSAGRMVDGTIQVYEDILEKRRAK